MYVLVGTYVLTSLARHVVLAGIGAGAGRDRLMSGIYNWYMYIRYCTLFVYLYICIDYSGGKWVLCEGCEVRRYSGTWNVVYEVFFFYFFFSLPFFWVLVLVLVLVEEKEKERKRKRKKKGKKGRGRL